MCCDHIFMLLFIQIYAVFSSENGWTADQRSKITRVDRDIPCSVTDTAIMTRKDSALPALFNTAFNKLKNTGWFPRFCTATNAKHCEYTKLEALQQTQQQIMLKLSSSN